MISFGLVQVAVSLISATEDKDLKFHQIHNKDGGRIRYRKTCEIDGAEVTQDDIAKGYPISKDDLVVLTDKDFDNLPLSSVRSMEVLEFVPEGQVDPILYEKSYYLKPDKIAVKPYVLLRDAIAASGRVAVCKVTLRSREQLGTIRVYQDVLVLETMRWPDEVREFALDVDTSDAPRRQEVQMARSVIEGMTHDWDPADTRFHDDYRQALRELVDAKVEGREVVQPAVSEKNAAAVTDLMDALKASMAGIQDAKARPAKKAAAKKAAPAKRAAKKSA